MKIEHIAIWVNDLEKMKEFYTKFFNLACSELYKNPNTGFQSYFLSFSSGARIELMHRDDINLPHNTSQLGFAHISISLGSKVMVDEFTQIFNRNGYKILSQPRRTGDGYYESVVLDPENNLIELTV